MKKNSLITARSVDELFERHEACRSTRDTLRSFYYSDRASTEKRTQEKQKSKVYDRLARKEREDISAASSKDGAVPVMMIGTQGTCVGSTIKKHLRWGGKQLRKRHRRYTVVAMTNEYRPSQTCVGCFGSVVRPSGRKMIDGKLKTVPVNGASICFNTKCPMYRKSINTQNRDTEAAVCIALAGASQLLAGPTCPRYADPVITKLANHFLPRLHRHCTMRRRSLRKQVSYG